MKLRAISLTAITLLACASAAVSQAADNAPASLRHIVDQNVQPVMKEYGIAGMAVGIVDANGEHVFNYGVASKESRRPVTGDTLFELGSVSKTLTATLASYAQVRGDLSLKDPIAQYLPSQRDSAFGKVSLLELGTHTPGGLPLQVPDDIHDNAQLIRYFQTWRPTYAPGTYRTYANPGIGMLGLITARSMKQDFDALMEKQLLPALGMKNSFIHVPASRLPDYAEGYTKQDSPIRMKPGVLSSEAYGIKTTAADMTRFLAANLHLIRLDPTLERAITETHTGYFTAGAMTQDLIWEQYSYPVALKTLLDGNSPAMILHATPVSAIEPPQGPREDVWINKTGSTNGFGAYVAFVPQKRLGIVMLANKNIPNDARVTMTYRILTSLANRKP